MSKCAHCGDTLPPRPIGARGPAPKYCQKVTCNAQYRQRKSKVSYSITRSFTGWTKYGGGFHNLSRADAEDWVCQACGRNQPKEIPGYAYPIGMSAREFIRACSKCHHKGLKKRIENARNLIRYIRGNL